MLPKNAMESYEGTNQMAEISSRIWDTMVGKIGYRVLAVTGPNFPEKDKIIHIGDYVFESEFTTSQFGDQKVFFQQQYFDKELDYYPDWNEKVTDDFLEEEGLPYKYDFYLPKW